MNLVPGSGLLGGAPVFHGGTRCLALIALSSFAFVLAYVSAGIDFDASTIIGSGV